MESTRRKLSSKLVDKMTNKYNRIIQKLLRVGRPKGKKYYPVTFTLTQEQIEFLNRQPNASELIRKILDDLIASRKDIQEKFSVISLNNQLAMFEEEKRKLETEKWNHVWYNWEKRWKIIIGSDGQKYVDWQDDKRLIPKPLDTEDSQVAFRVLIEYDKAIAFLEQKIMLIKKQILQTE